MLKWRMCGGNHGCNVGETQVFHSSRIYARNQNVFYLWLTLDVAFGKSFQHTLSYRGYKVIDEEERKSFPRKKYYRRTGLEIEVSVREGEIMRCGNGGSEEEMKSRKREILVLKLKDLCTPEARTFPPFILSLVSHSTRVSSPSTDRM